MTFQGRRAAEIAKELGHSELFELLVRIFAEMASFLGKVSIHPTNLLKGAEDDKEEAVPEKEDPTAQVGVSHFVPLISFGVEIVWSS